MSKATFGPTFFPALGPAKVSGALVPDGWDKAVLADQILPGYSSILRGGVRLKYDPKRKSGADNTNPTFHGLDPQPLELEVITYSDDDRETLASVVRSIIPKAGKTPAPVSIDHPAIRHLGITSVQVIGVSHLQPMGPGVAKLVFDLLHWERPKQGKKSATTTPTRKVDNQRKAANDKKTNPPPTQQPGPWAPPNFTGGG